MSGSADRLLRLIYDWIQEASECSSNLRALARELETLRGGCNLWKTAGSTVAVVGSALAVGASFFTGGASLALWGAVGGGVGTGISLVTNIAESFMSSNELKKIEKIDKKCNKIADKIKKLFDELRKECPSSSADEQDQYVVKEFLKAMSRRSIQNSDIDREDLVDLIPDLKDTLHICLATLALDHEVLEVLSIFLDCVQWKLLAAAGGQQIGKAAALQVSPGLEGMTTAFLERGQQLGKSVVVRGATRFLGIAGLAISLREARDNWTKAIEDKHETKATKSLRDTATQIDKASRNLSNNLSKIQKMIEEAVKTHCSTGEDKECEVVEVDQELEMAMGLERETKLVALMMEMLFFQPIYKFLRKSGEEDEESEEEDEEDELRMALINARSINKFIRTRDNTPLQHLIMNNNLDVFLITETWLPTGTVSNDALRSILPPNYSYLSEPRFYGRGGGLSIVFSKEFECKMILEDVREIDRLALSFEYLAARLNSPRFHESILILIIYRPPDTSLKDFLKELKDLLLRLFFHYGYRHAVIAGDFNIWVDCPNGIDSKRFFEFLRRFRLDQHVNESTHIGGHTLDLVVAPSEVRINISSVEPNSFSDHHTVFFTLGGLKRKKKSEKRKKLKRD